MCVCACARVYEYRVLSNGFTTAISRACVPPVTSDWFPRRVMMIIIMVFFVFLSTVYTVLLLLLFCFFSTTTTTIIAEPQNHDLGSGPDTVFYVPAIRRCSVPPLHRLPTPSQRSHLQPTRRQPPTRVYRCHAHTGAVRLPSGSEGPPSRRQRLGQLEPVVRVSLPTRL